MGAFQPSFCRATDTHAAQLTLTSSTTMEIQQPATCNQPEAETEENSTIVKKKKITPTTQSTGVEYSGHEPTKSWHRIWAPLRKINISN